MCMFCAAIPATAAIAAKMNADQQAEIHQAQESGSEVREKPIKAISAGLIVILIAASLVYHTRFNTFI